MKKSFTRRSFIRSTIGAGAAIAGAGLSIPDAFGNPAVQKKPYDPKGLPTTILGKTGVTVPRIAIGLGSRFLTIESLDEALDMCNYALDNGLYYWDTAHTYVNNQNGAVSEERLGHIIKDRRKEIFLSTKIAAREADEAKKQIELSLKRLRTDKLDMMKIHAVESADDVRNIMKSGGIMELFLKMKQEKVTRFIGFSGHSNAEALKMLVDTGNFDSMLFAMNHYGNGKDDRQGLVIPAARARGMGIMLMKTIRPKETISGLDPADLVRFALSLEGPSGIAVGMDSRKVVDSNLSLLRNFKPMGEDERKKYAERLQPFFRHENLEWMKTGYRDGRLA